MSEDEFTSITRQSRGGEGKVEKRVVEFKHVYGERNDYQIQTFEKQ
jgi:hypothetical protein